MLKRKYDKCKNKNKNNFTVIVKFDAFLLFSHEVWGFGAQNRILFNIYIYTMYLINETICVLSSAYCKLIALVLLSLIYVDLIVLVANVLCYFYRLVK